MCVSVCVSGLQLLMVFGQTVQQSLLEVLFRSLRNQDLQQDVPQTVNQVSDRKWTGIEEVSTFIKLDQERREMMS